MPSPTEIQATLRAQGAPETHLTRIRELISLAEREPNLLAVFLVGSYAKGVGDRISDLDLAVIASAGHGPAILEAAKGFLGRADVLNQFSGEHPAGGSFCKLVYLDFSSVEIHVFEPDTKFRLKNPHLSVWDPGKLLPSYVVAGEPIRHEDFAAYEYGDEGLIWELVDCIKWLSRGRNELARSHLKKLATEIKKRDAGQ